METIYVDVLLILNIYVNFFLLRITGAITGSALKTKRCIAAAIYGSFFSLLIIAPDLGIAAVTAIKSAAAVTIVMLAFGVHGKKRLLKDTAAFFAANFILAGTVYAVCCWLKPDFIHISKSFIYIDLSLIVLVLSTAGLYLAVSLIRRFSLTDDAYGSCFHVMIRHRDICVNLSGLADTGNRLMDHFSGKPVIVCDKDIFLQDCDISPAALPRGFRLIPCGTVSGSSIIPVFSPDEVIITNDSSGERKAVSAVIGLGESSGKAIFNPAILKR